MRKKQNKIKHTISAFFVFCLSGVSIEFLCFPRPEEPIEHVMSCLQALCTLLESPYAKSHIAEDQVKKAHVRLQITLISGCSIFV